MARLWQLIMKGEKGQALLVVLGLLVIGGLFIAPCLHYASTSLKAGIIIEENVRGLYAADAGVEYALWQITKGIEPPEIQPLPENVNVNQMEVIIETDYLGRYTLYFGRLRELSTQQTQEDHYKFLAVNGEMTPDGEETFRYTITVTRQPEAAGEVIHLVEVGVRLPVGYSYQLGSAAGVPDNLSPGEPEMTIIELYGADIQMLKWTLAPPPPEVLQGEPATQEFYVTGPSEGDQGGDYAWVAAGRLDIGVVSEVIGTFYKITATATRPEDEENIIARVVADVMFNEETEKIHSISWQINPQ